MHPYFIEQLSRIRRQEFEEEIKRIHLSRKMKGQGHKRNFFHFFLDLMSGKKRHEEKVADSGGARSLNTTSAMAELEVNG